ncbi:MAG: protein kinase domain-containing protein [Chloroflexota bacterium]
MSNTQTDQLKTFCERLRRIEQPEELFGHLGVTESEQLQRLESCFRFLLKSYHPDKFAGQPALLPYANEITRLLNALKQRAVTKIKRNIYGSPGQPELREYTSVIRTHRREYFVTELRVEGAQADVYHAYYCDPDDVLKPWKEAAIKVIADPANNPLLDNEARFYETLSHFCFPACLDRFQTCDGKRAIVLDWIRDGYDLIELRRRYRNRYRVPGLPQEHLFWILDRFLCALGLMHAHGILHGNLQPDNLLVQPSLHNGMLIDFLHCRIAPVGGDVLAAVNPAYCAPEVFTRRFKPHPVSEIYALGRCMIELLGGDGDSLDDALPVDARLRAFLQKMILTDPSLRAGDAWALAEELKALRRALYGARTPFVSLDVT